MAVRKAIIAAVIIVACFAFFVWYLGTIGLLPAFISAILVIVIADPDRNLMASVYKLLRGVNFWFEKKAVQTRLESTIGSASRKINKEGVLLLPHGLKIKWAKPIDRDSFLKDGKIIVCLEPSDNESRNIARAALFYVREDLLQRSRRFIDRTVMKSVTFEVVRKMLMLDENIDALDCLSEEFMEPEAQKAQLIRDYVPAMDKMDEQGHFTRVLLQELSKLDAKLSPARSDIHSEKETSDLVLLLKTFEEREKEEEVQLKLKGRVISLNLMPVARMSTGFDATRYIKQASQCSKDGIEAIYVLARGNNVVLARLVSKALEDAKLYSKQREWSFIVEKKRNPKHGYVAVLTKRS
ncbi:MAG: hypothetical protein WED05_10090 [Candidatus Atabeyarchaeum deiterrae]